MYASGIDNTEHSTKITYYTPKVGNDMNKVQAGVSYAPNMYDYGSNNVKFNNVTTSTTGLTNNSLSVSPYQDVVKGAVEYTGNFHPVNVAASAQILNGESSHVAMSSTTLGGAASGGGLTDQAANGLLGQKAQDFTAFGVGAQVGFAGFTVGGSYNDMGRYDTVHGQNKSQQNFTLGGKYEFDKVAVAANWLNGEGYDNLLTHAAGDYYAGSRTNTNYVSNFNAYGAGASYTWFPGMSSNVDGVLFNQAVDGQRDHNDGYVLLVSQKLAF
jgi:hypothetical protein